MLDGDALTAVEHLDFAEFAIVGGEILIFNILEARYPDKDPIHRASKGLFDVFEVSAREGERLSELSAKAESVLRLSERCRRRVSRHGKRIFVPASLWSVGRSESSGVGSHWRCVRKCKDCTSSEVVLSRVPSSKAQSKVSRSVRVGNARRRRRRRGRDRRRCEH